MARKAVRAMRPRMMVGVGARQWVMAIDGYHYTENTPTVAKDDPMLDAAPYWLYGCYVPATDELPAYDGGIHYYGGRHDAC
jgi:hypothetical protein